MRDDRPLTTGEVGSYCGVSHATVWKWIKKGRLKAYRLRGGQYRIEKGALKAFLQENNMPIDAEFFARPIKRVLIIDDEPTVADLITRAMQQLDEEIQYATANDGFEAGLQLATFKPDLLLLDLMMGLMLVNIILLMLMLRIFKKCIRLMNRLMSRLIMILQPWELIALQKALAEGSAL